MRAPTLVVIGAIAVVLFIFVQWLFYLALIGGVVYVLWYFSREKCPKCGKYGTIKFAGSEVINTERGYGIVTRHDTTTKAKRDNRGRNVNETSTTTRQERAPVVRTTSRATYRCETCGYSHSRDSVREEEDFSDRVAKEKETVIVQKEVVKVPCKYCGALNDIATTRNCSNCGAVIK